MLLFLLAPFALQAFLMAIDEWIFHRRRGLGWWERLGHPIDTLSVIVCLGMASFLPYTDSNAFIFLAAALVSCVMVSKDEWVHVRECNGFENWLHALLFMVHPLVLGAAFVLWLFRVDLLVPSPEGELIISARLAISNPPSALMSRFCLYGLTILTSMFFFYQLKSVARPRGRKAQNMSSAQRAAAPHSDQLTTHSSPKAEKTAAEQTPNDGVPMSPEAIEGADNDRAEWGQSGSDSDPKSR